MVNPNLRKSTKTYTKLSIILSYNDETYFGKYYKTGELIKSQLIL